MKRTAKNATLWVGRNIGVFGLVSRSAWRSERLLILCYHGISLRDEHEWRPGLYVSPQTFRHRMQLLADGGYNVLPLGEALERLARKDLPPRSIVITFDDGFHDFYQLAYPILKEFAFPATVYLTTYYAGLNVPIFNLITSYLLWKKRGGHFERVDKRFGGFLDLRTRAAVDCCWKRINNYADEQQLSASEKDGLAAELCAAVGERYAEIRELRMLQIMSPDEIAQMSQAGIEIQLHTHRHRTPIDRELFLREVEENRRRIREITGRTANHFCYPSGVFALEFLPWLNECGIKSAATCELAIADSNSSPLLMPRLLDAHNISDDEFESWMSGFRPRFLNRVGPQHSAALAI